MPSQPERRGRSILIVEDDPVTRAALVMILAHLGYETVPVASVAEGIAKLDGQDCAILDLNLQDGLGTVVLGRIRTEKRAIRVAITTATTDVDLLADAARLEPELILRKPIDVSALLGWVEGAG